MRKMLPAKMLLLILFWTSLSLTANADNIYHDRATGISFPKQLGNLKHFKSFKYQNPALGISLKYALGKNTTADIYIYNFNKKGIGNNEITKPVTQQFVRAIAEIFTMQSMGRYQNVQPFIGQKKLKLSLKRIGKQQFIWADFTYAKTNPKHLSHKTRKSYLFLTSKKNQFIKIRYTYMNSDGKKGYRELNKFMNAFARKL